MGITPQAVGEYKQHPPKVFGSARHLACGGVGNALLQCRIFKHLLTTRRRLAGAGTVYAALNGERNPMLMK